MGATQSTSKEPVIFYNPNVPLQFSTSLVQSLENKANQTNEKIEARQVESIVCQRVAKELEEIKSSESYIELTEKDNLNAVTTNNDIETMIKRIFRSNGKEIPAEIKQHQDKVIACYNKNKSRSLDCWKEVADFKEAVTQEQKRFVASNQK